MSAERARLLALAAAISDGAEVSWDSEMANSREDTERSLLRSLRLVAGVAEVHRSLHLVPGAPGDKIDATSTLSGDATPSADDDSRLDAGIPLSWGPLDILDKLGEGAFGEVYLAHDPRLDREVALKLLRRRDSDRAEMASAVIEEGRLLARIRHPNVAVVHGAERHDGRVGLWMELIRGRTLADLLHEQGPFGAREAALVGIDLCRALAAVHAAGVIHRDIKATNVMREEGGRIVLMDFGAGRETRDLEAASATSSGTPLYMAPELFLGAHASKASDIYGLGVLLYYLVTGSFPVLGGSFRELVGAHERGAAKLLRDARPDLPGAFVQAVERALARDPKRRYPSAGTMEAALSAALGSQEAVREAVPRKRGLSILFKLGPIQISVAAFVVLAGFAILVGYEERWRLGYRPTTSPRTLRTSPSVEGRGSVPILEPQRPTVGSPGDSGEGLPASAPGIRQPAPPLPATATTADMRKLAESLGETAALKEAMGKPADARLLYERTLAIQEKVLAPDDADLATTLTRLGALLRDAGDLKGAERMLTRAVTIRSKQAAAPTPERKTVSLASLSEAQADVPEYTIKTTLYRKRAGVEAALADGDQVRVGDHLFLKLDASRPVFAYVLSEDDAGRAFRLFPMPGFDVANPLAPGDTHRIPGKSLSTGKVVSWQVDTAGGREHFLVVVSPKPLDEFEARMQALAVPGEPSSAVAQVLPNETVRRLRGIGGLAEEAVASQPEPKKGAGRLFELARRLAGEPEKARGVWIRQIDLENPRP